MIGSIGAMYLHENHSKMIAKNVGEMRIIRAPQSVDKARINNIEPLTDTLEKEILGQLEEITNDFIGAVRDGRGDRLDTGDTDIFTGKMFGGKEAVKMGMVDREGTFSDAVQTAYELGNLVKEVNTILN
jgi:protease-4